MSTQTSIKNITDDINTEVGFETSIIFSTVTIFSFIILSIILFCKLDKQAKPSIRRDGLALLAFTAFVTFIADLLHDEAYYVTEVYNIYQITKIILIGCIVLVIGAICLFDIRQDDENDMKAIGHNHLNISIFIVLITLFLVLMEVFMVYGCIKTKDNQFGHLGWILIAYGTIQKSIQAYLYHFNLQFRIPAKGKYLNASWYLKLSALFNLSMWLESIIVSDKQGHECIKASVGSGESIFSAVYSALIIDYRLVCFILFVEHALVIDIFWFKKESKKKQKNTIVDEHIASLDLPPIPEESFKESQQLQASKYLYSGIGFGLGAIIFILQFLNALQYKEDSASWTTIFGILSDVAVVIAGCILTSQISQESEAPHEEKEENEIISHSIDILVVLMGTIGILFWVLKSSVILTWAIRYTYINDEKDTYFYWNGTKFLIRTLSLIFQIYLFNKIPDATFTSQQESQSKTMIDLSLPLLTLSFLSVFVNSIIDSFNSSGEDLFREANTKTILTVLYQSGSPIHLGFCLHMVIHFFLILTKFNQGIIPARKDNDVHKRNYDVRKRNDDVRKRNDDAADDDDDDKTTPLLKDVHA